MRGILGPWANQNPGLFYGVLSLVAISLLLVYLRFFADTLFRRRRAARRIQRCRSRLVADPTNKLLREALRRSATSWYCFERFYAMTTAGEIFADLQLKSDFPSTCGEFVAKLCDLGLRDSNPFVRNAAACSLSRMSVTAGLALSSLARCVEQFPHEGTGMYAAIALGNVGDASPEVLDALRSVGREPNSLTFDAAQQAHYRLTREYFPVLQESIEDDDEDDLQTGQPMPA